MRKDAAFRCASIPHSARLVSVRGGIRVNTSIIMRRKYAKGSFDKRILDRRGVK